MLLVRVFPHTNRNETETLASIAMSHMESGTCQRGSSNFVLFDLCTVQCTHTCTYREEERREGKGEEGRGEERRGGKRRGR